LIECIVNMEAEQYPKMITLTIDADGTYYLTGDDGLPHELVNQQLETFKQELLKLAEQSKDKP